MEFHTDWCPAHFVRAANPINAESYTSDFWQGLVLAVLLFLFCVHDCELYSGNVQLFAAHGATIGESFLNEIPVASDPTVMIRRLTDPVYSVLLYLSGTEICFECAQANERSVLAFERKTLISGSSFFSSDSRSYSCYFHNTSGINLDN
jgi:hypothetical protein